MSAARRQRCFAIDVVGGYENQTRAHALDHQTQNTPPSLQFTFIDYRGDGEGGVPTPTSGPSRHGFTSIKVDEVERMKPLARSPRKRTAPRRLPRYAEQSRWSQLGGAPAPKCHAQHVSQKWNCRTNAHVKCRVMPFASPMQCHLPLGTRTSPHNRLLELQNQCTCQMPSVLKCNSLTARSGTNAESSRIGATPTTS